VKKLAVISILSLIIISCSNRESSLISYITHDEVVKEFRVGQKWCYREKYYDSLYSGPPYLDTIPELGGIYNSSVINYKVVGDTTVEGQEGYVITANRYQKDYPGDSSYHTSGRFIICFCGDTIKSYKYNNSYPMPLLKSSGQQYTFDVSLFNDLVFPLVLGKNDGWYYRPEGHPIEAWPLYNRCTGMEKIEVEAGKFLAYRIETDYLGMIDDITWTRWISSIGLVKFRIDFGINENRIPPTHEIIERELYRADNIDPDEVPFIW
jgi:hypothetical protein